MAIHKYFVTIDMQISTFLFTKKKININHFWSVRTKTLKPSGFLKVFLEHSPHHAMFQFGMV